ncbi:FtsQ-type POTRA domain-containing protein [Gemella sp. GH3]|uniref:cell division protein FtsQ/DivIB n=1 Tax=unclassified Gemella TaxID=2624949 RepID=UPI0015D0601C|nr:MULTISPECIES: FtsQ-type POTRA domain-containing protein [unclassified Gemella]MBF0714288.1 FtsQ-type POTRA domain-containing protein [Gemella sp. GH3.1]NYS51240.1 FtsQ-type POTRA domain-containing protein [Gemella sp. GH3]
MNLKNKKLLQKSRDKNHKTALSRYKKKRNIEIIIFSLVVVFGILVFIFLNSSYVKLKNINITGLVQLTEEDIQNTTAINNDVKIWDVDEDKFENKIKENYNIVESVSVTTKWLQTINIDIKEKRLIAREKADNNYNIIMSDGNIHNGKLSKQLDLPILTNFENATKKQELLKNLIELKEEILMQISEIVDDRDNEQVALVYMKDGQRVKINVSNFSSKLNYYFEMSQHIDDKKGTILNLINGSYLETEKSNKLKENKIKDILQKSKDVKSENNEDNNKEKRNN